MRVFIVVVIFLVVGACAHSAKQGTAAAQGKMISVPTAIGTRFNAFAVGPVNAQRGAVLIPGRHGLDRAMRDESRRLAAQGFQVLAVDLFDGRTVPGKGEYDVLGDIDPVWMATDVAAAIRYLKAPGRKLVAVGWGTSGSGQALQAAMDSSAVVAAVILINDLPALRVDQAQALRAAVLALLPDNNSETVRERITAFQEVMAEGDAPLRIIRYDMAGGRLDPGSLAHAKEVRKGLLADIDRFLDRYL